jgi:AcrR family transcriptional regulator
MSPRPAKAVRGRLGNDPASALRDLLIDTAERLVEAKPASSITTREIARAAGVSDGVLYNYFADKNELIITALVRRYTEAVSRYDVAVPAPGSGSVEENLVTCLRAAIDLVASALPMAGTLLSEPALLQRFFTEVHTHPLGLHRMVGPVAQYLAAEQAAGRLGSFDVDAAGVLLLGPAIMLGFLIVMDGAPRDRVVGQLPGIVATLLRGLDRQSTA